MKSETRILGISGSLRQQSYIRHLLENLVDLMQRMGQPSTSVHISDSRTLFAASTT
jgi:NAD(P)H-dependent FMN reductase